MNCLTLINLILIFNLNMSDNENDESMSVSDRQEDIDSIII